MLDVKIDSINFYGESQSEPLLENIAFKLEVNSIQTIIGENGAGKTTLIKSLTNLFDARTGCIAGKVLLDGEELLNRDDQFLLDIRQKKIRYVFQDAVNCFDPLKTLHYYFDKINEDETAVNEILNYFLLPDLKTISKLYPYELSGGMAQRINLALAMLAKPQVLILDEPTSSIDIPIANIVAKKIKEFSNKNSSSVLIITQDLDFAFEVSDKIAYLGNGTLTDFYSISTFNELKKNTDFNLIKKKFAGLKI